MAIPDEKVKIEMLPEEVKKAQPSNPIADLQQDDISWLQEELASTYASVQALALDQQIL